MKTKDFEKLIKMMGQIIDMKHEMQSKSEEDEDDDECNECTECAIEQKLKQEYTDMMDWAFGKHFKGDTKERTKEIWRALHPHLPCPRILNSECCDTLANTLGMVLDVLPLYLKEKK